MLACALSFLEDLMHHHLVNLGSKRHVEEGVNRRSFLQHEHEVDHRLRVAEEGAQSHPLGVGDLGQPTFVHTANKLRGSERWAKSCENKKQVRQHNLKIYTISKGAKYNTCLYKVLTFVQSICRQKKCTV